MRDRDARGNQNSPKEQEHTHPVESGERKIVRAQKGHQSRKKQVQIVVTYGHKKQHRKRQNKRDLHPEEMERIVFAHGRGAARQTQQQLRERKDEKSADDDGQDRRFWSDPRAQRRGHQPNYGRDKLSPKAANVDRPHFALRVLDVHANLRNEGVAARYISTPPTALTRAVTPTGLAQLVDSTGKAAHNPQVLGPNRSPFSFLVSAP